MFYYNQGGLSRPSYSGLYVGNNASPYLQGIIAPYVVSYGLDSGRASFSSQTTLSEWDITKVAVVNAVHTTINASGAPRPVVGFNSSVSTSGDFPPSTLIASHYGAAHTTPKPISSLTGLQATAGNIDRGGRINSIYGFSIESYSATPSGAGSLVGIYGGAGNYSSGTVNDATSLYAWVYNSYPVTSSYAIYAEVGGVNSTNAYGIYVTNVSAVNSNNAYAIYTNSGRVRFGGNVTLAANSFPLSGTAPGVSGQIALSTTHFYWHNGTEWLRVSGSTF